MRRLVDFIHQVPDSPLMVGSDVVPPVRLVRDLGIHLDSNSMMRTHVTWSVSTCLAALQQVRSMTVDQSFSSTIAHRVVGTITTGLRERDTGSMAFLLISFTDYSQC